MLRRLIKEQGPPPPNCDLRRYWVELFLGYIEIFFLYDSAGSGSYTFVIRKTL